MENNIKKKVEINWFLEGVHFEFFKDFDESHEEQSDMHGYFSTLSKFISSTNDPRLNVVHTDYRIGDYSMAMMDLLGSYIKIEFDFVKSLSIHDSITIDCFDMDSEIAASFKGIIDNSQVFFVVTGKKYITRDHIELSLLPMQFGEKLHYDADKFKVY